MASNAEPKDLDSEENKLPKTKGRVRRWLRRIAVCLCVLIILLVVSLRPLLFYGGHYVVTNIVAGREHLDIGYDIGGTLFSSIRITNLHFRTLAANPPASITAGKIDLEYSLPGLVREGLAGFLKTVDIENVSGEMTAPPATPPPHKKPSGPVVIPPLFPQTLKIVNVNFLMHEPAGDLRVNGLTFTLLPDKPGELAMHDLNIPGLHEWRDISAATGYGRRDLTITDLAIDQDINISRLNLDASAIDKSRLGFDLSASLFGSSVSATAQVADIGKSNSIGAEANIKGLSIDRVMQYLNIAAPARGTIESVSLQFHGEPDKPAAWKGNVDAHLDGLLLNKQALGTVDAGITLKDGKAVASITAQPGGGNKLQIDATSILPEKAGGFVTSPVSGGINGELPDFSFFSPVAGTTLAGKGVLEMSFAFRDRKLSTDLRFTAVDLAAANATMAAADIKLHLEDLIPADKNTSPVENLSLRLDGSAGLPGFQNYSADKLKFAVALKDRKLNLDDLSLERGKNHATVHGFVMIPADLRSWISQQVGLDLAIAVPDLGDFAPDGNLTGALQLDGHFSGEAANPSGEIQITGRTIQSESLTVQSIDAKLTAGNHHVSLPQLLVVMDDHNSLKAGLEADIARPFAYKGTLDAAFNDLSVFQPLVVAGRIGGTLTASWSGDGNISEMKHTGRVAVDLTGGHYATLENLSAHIGGGYSATDIDLPGIKLSAGKLGDASLGIALHNKRFTVSGISVRQGKLSLLEGNIDLPCDLTKAQTPNKIVGTDQPLSIDLQTKNLSIAELLTQNGQKKPAMTGTVNMKTAFGGSLDKLTGSVTLGATQLQSTTAETFAPAEASVIVSVASNTMSLAGSVRQKLIQPLQISGAIPFDTGKIVRSGKIDPATPLDLRIILPKTSLEFLPSLAPALRQSWGMADANIEIDGTIQKPKITGDIDVNLSTLRFANATLPSLSDTGIRLAFTPDKIEIQHCAGMAGGGSFGAGGTINLAKPANPVLNLWASSNQALAVQNENLTARVSSNIRVTGPVSAGSVSGQVFITKTRFFKDIDILPIGLPGRPAPEPPPAPSVVSFPKPPLRDWKFDVTVRTADPIVIQGNLARGTIGVDLHLGGTGLRPWLDGNAWIVKLTASLPFSQLQIESGFIYFLRSDPFNPHINIHGTSTIRDYAVSVYIYGSAQDPQAVFSSNPPLPQADVVSLIATGMTTKELQGNPNALAGQAAILLVRKLYSTVFKSSRPSDDNSILNRLRVDLGVIDPRTGRQSVSLGIPLTPQVMLMGGLDVGGNFRGELKYIVRFK